MNLHIAFGVLVLALTFTLWVDQLAGLVLDRDWTVEGMVGSCVGIAISVAYLAA